MTRRLFPIVAAALLSVALGVGVTGCNRKEPPPAPPPPPPLTQQGLVFSSWKSATPNLHDRLLLAHAMAAGKNEAIVMVATRMGGTPAVAAQIARLGGQIQGRFDDVGYLYALLPIERLAEVSALPDVLMAHLDGGAPGGSSARLQTDRSLAIEIDRMLEAAKVEQLDFIPEARAEGHVPTGGQDIVALIADRAVEVLGPPMFAVSGDGARLDSIPAAASARRVLAVGGLKVDLSETTNSTLNRELVDWPSVGPAGDGGAKPDVIVEPNQQDASSGRIAATIAEFRTSARAEHLPADARHLSWALRMGARPLEGYQVHEQGFGVIDPTRATELLREVKSRKFDLPDILVRAPVKTFLSRLLPEPGVGQGLYEREGWLLKRTDKRVITLVRQSGALTPLTYSLQWRGNDGTFKTLQNEVTLPFDTPVDVAIEITPTRFGVHSAHLYLLDKATALPVQAVMTTIVASEQFTAANGYTIRHDAQALTNKRSSRYFMEVPPNVASLRVSVDTTVGEAEVLLGMGGPVDDRFNLPRSGASAAPGKPRVVTVPYPPAGVYELTLLPSGKAQADVSASIYYVDSQLDQAPPANNSTTLWMNNIYAPLQRSAVITEVGARRVLEDVGGPTGMRAYNIDVPADSTSLRVAASPPDGRARLGLYLYECLTGQCVLRDSDALTRTLDKILIVPEPSPGLWRVVVDASAPGTAFKYSEVVTNPRFGSGKAGGTDEPRRIGARWNQSVSFRIQQPVAFGYEAVAVMDLIDREGDVGPRPVRLTTQVFKLN